MGLESSIYLSSDGAHHRQSVGKETCELRDEIIKASEIANSPFQNDFIVFDDFLYERFSVRPDKIPERLGEVLCRDSFNDPKSEIVAHYNSSTKMADITFYGDLGPQPISHPSRIYSFNGMIYRSNSFELKIDFERHIPKTGRFPGTYLTGTQTKNLDCVVGGEIDRTIWPVKKEVDTPVFPFFTSLPQSKSAFIYSEKQGKTRAFKEVLDNGKKIDLSAGLFGSLNSTGSCCDIRMSASKNQALVGDWAGLKSKYYFADFNLNKKAEINLFGFDDNIYIGFYPSVLQVGPVTLIHGYSKTLNKHALIMYRESDGSTLLDQFSWTTILTKNVNDKLHYLTFIDQVLYFNELDLVTFRVKRTRGSELGFSSFSTGIPFYELPTAGKYLHMQITNSETIFSEFTVIDLKAGNSTTIATNVQSVWNSQDHSLFLLCDLTRKVDPINRSISINCEGDYKKLYVASLNKIIELSTPIKKIDNNISSQLYAAIAETKDGKIFALSDDTSQSIVEISPEGSKALTSCNQKDFTSVALLQDEGKNTYVISLNSPDKVYDISRVHSGGCTRVNQFPAVSEYLSAIQALDGGFSVTFREVNSYSKNQVVYVPLSGRSAVLLNPQSKDFSFNGFMHMNADHTKVYLIGYSDLEKESYLYSFKIK